MDDDLNRQLVDSNKASVQLAPQMGANEKCQEHDFFSATCFHCLCAALGSEQSSLSEKWSAFLALKQFLKRARELSVPDFTLFSHVSLIAISSPLSHTALIEGLTSLLLNSRAFAASVQGRSSRMLLIAVSEALTDVLARYSTQNCKDSIVALCAVLVSLLEPASAQLSRELFCEKCRHVLVSSSELIGSMDMQSLAAIAALWSAVSQCSQGVIVLRKCEIYSVADILLKRACAGDDEHHRRFLLHTIGALVRSLPLAALDLAAISEKLFCALAPLIAHIQNFEIHYFSLMIASKVLDIMRSTNDSLSGSAVSSLIVDAIALLERYADGSLPFSMSAACLLVIDLLTCFASSLSSSSTSLSMTTSSTLGRICSAVLRFRERITSNRISLAHNPTLSEINVKSLQLLYHTGLIPGFGVTFFRSLTPVTLSSLVSNCLVTSISRENIAEICTIIREALSVMNEISDALLGEIVSWCRDSFHLLWHDAPRALDNVQQCAADCTALASALSVFLALCDHVAGNTAQWLLLNTHFVRDICDTLDKCRCFTHSLFDNSTSSERHSVQRRLLLDVCEVAERIFARLFDAAECKVEFAALITQRNLLTVIPALRSLVFRSALCEVSQSAVNFPSLLTSALCMSFVEDDDCATPLTVELRQQLLKLTESGEYILDSCAVLQSASKFSASHHLAALCVIVCNTLYNPALASAQKHAFGDCVQQFLQKSRSSSNEALHFARLAVPLLILLNQNELKSLHLEPWLAVGVPRAGMLVHCDVDRSSPLRERSVSLSTTVLSALLVGKYEHHVCRLLQRQLSLSKPTPSDIETWQRLISSSSSLLPRLSLRETLLRTAQNRDAFIQALRILPRTFDGNFDYSLLITQSLSRLRKRPAAEATLELHCAFVLGVVEFASDLLDSIPSESPPELCFPSIQSIAISVLQWFSRYFDTQSNSQALAGSDDDTQPPEGLFESTLLPCERSVRDACLNFVSNTVRRSVLQCRICTLHEAFYSSLPIIVRILEKYDASFFRHSLCECAVAVESSTFFDESRNWQHLLAHCAYWALDSNETLLNSLCTSIEPQLSLRVVKHMTASFSALQLCVKHNLLAISVTDKNVMNFCAPRSASAALATDDTERAQLSANGEKVVKKDAPKNASIEESLLCDGNAVSAVRQRYKGPFQWFAQGLLGVFQTVQHSHGALRYGTTESDDAFQVFFSASEAAAAANYGESFLLFSPAEETNDHHNVSDVKVALVRRPPHSSSAKSEFSDCNFRNTLDTVSLLLCDVVEEGVLEAIPQLSEVVLAQCPNAKHSMFSTPRFSSRRGCFGVFRSVLFDQEDILVLRLPRSLFSAKSKAVKGGAAKKRPRQSVQTSKPSIERDDECKIAQKSNNASVAPPPEQDTLALPAIRNVSVPPPSFFIAPMMAAVNLMTRAESDDTLRAHCVSLLARTVSCTNVIPTDLMEPILDHDAWLVQLLPELCSETQQWKQWLCSLLHLVVVSRPRWLSDFVTDFVQRSPSRNSILVELCRQIAYFTSSLSEHTTNEASCRILYLLLCIPTLMSYVEISKKSFVRELVSTTVRSVKEAFAALRAVSTKATKVSRELHALLDGSVNEGVIVETLCQRENRHQEIPQIVLLFCTKSLPTLLRSR